MRTQMQTKPQHNMNPAQTMCFALSHGMAHPREEQNFNKLIYTLVTDRIGTSVFLFMDLLN